MRDRCTTFHGRRKPRATSFSKSPASGTRRGESSSRNDPSGGELPFAAVHQPLERGDDRGLRPIAIADVMMDDPPGAIDDERFRITGDAEIGADLPALVEQYREREAVLVDPRPDFARR